MSEPDADPADVVSLEPRPARHSFALLLAVFVVAMVCVNLWPDEGDLASSAEATGIPAEAVVASLTAERREHATRAAALRTLETGGAPTSGGTAQSPQSPGGTNPGTKDADGQPASPVPTGGGGETPVDPREPGNLTLPIVGETPLEEPELPEVSEVPALELPPLPKTTTLPDVQLPVDPETLLP